MIAETHNHDTVTRCYHCGEDCADAPVLADNRSFCCDGCRLVYELLNENELCTYYTLNQTPGSTAGKQTAKRFAYLDHPEIRAKLIDFTDNSQTHVTFFIPSMHCSSCIWLLENLHRLDPAVISSRTNFLKKEVAIIFNEGTSLSKLAALLAQIGYEPLISLEAVKEKKPVPSRKKDILKIGIAGFCFGNIMMLSFPEYFSFGNFNSIPGLKSFFSVLNILLSLPVIFFSAGEFFISAWNGIRQRFLNIDIPIAFAIVVTFARSIYEIGFGVGPGFLDSMSGLIFFMLLGRYFQNVTYDAISFERDYRSFFPIAVTVRNNNEELIVPVEDLRVGNVIFLHNQEIMPADSILLSETAMIDYSFVTGESHPVALKAGDIVYAGGRTVQGSSEARVVHEVSQSYLTGLWNKDAGTDRPAENSFIHAVSRYFTIGLLLLAAGSFIFWTVNGETGRGLDALTTVLIVACPCALLLSATFTNGSVVRILSRAGLYVRNSDVIEKLGRTDTVIFDKTGTITHGSLVNHAGPALSSEEKQLVGSLVSISAHPLSRRIAAEFSLPRFAVTEFTEVPGGGMKGFVNGHYILLGSAYFVLGAESYGTDSSASQVFLMIDGKPRGHFRISNSYREGIFSLIGKLRSKYAVGLLSGDNAAERGNLEGVFGEKNIFFNQKPDEKAEFILSKRAEGAYVLMIGDGLNDAGAMSSSNVGIAVSDDANNFTPACDAILKGDSMHLLDKMIAFCRTGKKVIISSFAMSLVYNGVGLGFAVQGALSPVIAAILMPASSISIVLLCLVATNISARTKGLI